MWKLQWLVRQNETAQRAKFLVGLKTLVSPVPARLLHNYSVSKPTKVAYDMIASKCDIRKVTESTWQYINSPTKNVIFSQMENGNLTLYTETSSVFF